MGTFLEAAILKFVYDSANVACPLMLNAIIQYLAEDNVHGVTQKGIALVVALFCINISMTCILHQHFLRMFR